MLLFSLQIVYGFIMAFAHAGYDVLHAVVPFNAARATHTNLLVMWLLCGFMGAAYYIIPEESGRELHSVPLAKLQLGALVVTAGAWLTLREPAPARVNAARAPVTEPAPPSAPALTAPAPTAPADPATATPEAARAPAPAVAPATVSARPAAPVRRVAPRSRQPGATASMPSNTPAPAPTPAPAAPSAPPPSPPPAPAHLATPAPAAAPAPVRPARPPPPAGDPSPPPFVTF
jgi:hypothetical protein